MYKTEYHKNSNSSLVTTTATANLYPPCILPRYVSVTGTSAVPKTNFLLSPLWATSPLRTPLLALACRAYFNVSTLGSKLTVDNPVKKVLVANHE